MIISGCTSNTAATANYTDNETGISFSHPETWNITKLNSNQTEIIYGQTFAQNKTESTDFTQSGAPKMDSNGNLETTTTKTDYYSDNILLFKPIISVGISENNMDNYVHITIYNGKLDSKASSQYNINDFNTLVNSKYFKDYLNSSTFSSSTLESTENITFAGSNAIKYTFASQRGDNKKGVLKLVIFEKNGNYYELIMTGSDTSFETNKEGINTFINSFKVP